MRKANRKQRTEADSQILDRLSTIERMVFRGSVQMLSHGLFELFLPLQPRLALLTLFTYPCFNNMNKQLTVQ